MSLFDKYKENANNTINSVFGNSQGAKKIKTTGKMKTEEEILREIETLKRFINDDQQTPEGKMEMQSIIHALNWVLGNASEILN